MPHIFINNVNLNVLEYICGDRTVCSGEYSVCTQKCQSVLIWNTHIGVWPPTRLLSSPNNFPWAPIFTGVHQWELLCKTPTWDWDCSAVCILAIRVLETMLAFFQDMGEMLYLLCWNKKARETNTPYSGVNGPLVPMTKFTDCEGIAVPSCRKLASEDLLLSPDRTGDSFNWG